MQQLSRRSLVVLAVFCGTTDSREMRMARRVAAHSLAPLKKKEPACVTSSRMASGGQIRVFINDDNTRSFSFSDVPNARTKVMCGNNMGLGQPNCTSQPWKGWMPEFGNDNAPKMEQQPFPIKGSSEEEAEEETKLLFLDTLKSKHRKRSIQDPDQQSPLLFPSKFFQRMMEVKECSSHNCPCELEPEPPLLFKPYETMMEVVRPMCFAASDDQLRSLTKDPFSILVLGLGSGALPMNAVFTCRTFEPGGIKVETVEDDLSVINIATGLFGYHAITDVNTIENADAFPAVLERMDRGANYDVVMVDVFDHVGRVPDSCRNQTFINGVKRILRPNGRMVQIVPSSQDNGTLEEDYRTVFGHARVSSHTTVWEEESYRVIVAGALESEIQSGAPRDASSLLTVIVLMALLFSGLGV